MKRTNLTLREKVALKELKIEVYKRVLSILESAKDELLIRKLGHEIIKRNKSCRT